MDEKPKASWRRRILIGLGVLCGVLAVPIIILNIMFSAGAIRPERMQPAKEMLHVKPAPAAKAVQTSATLPAYIAKSETLPDPLKTFYGANPNQMAVRLYLKLDYQMTTDTVRNLFKKDFMTADRVDPKFVEWLRTHRDMVDDIFRLAAAGGIPTISNEQAAAIEAKHVPGIPVPNLLMSQEIAKILAAECRMRRDAGDIDGAVECILASETLAQSVDEPLVINVLVSSANKKTTYEELKVWLEKSEMPAESAKNLRAALEKVPPIDFRPAAELEYRSGRAGVVELLSGSYANVMRYSLRHEYRSLDFYSWTDEMWNAPGKTLGNTASAALVAAHIKASANSILTDFDTVFKKNYEILTPGRPLDRDAMKEMDKFIMSSPLIHLGGLSGPNYGYVKARGMEAEAQLQLDLAGLDRVVEPGTETVKRIDPFTATTLRYYDSADRRVIYSLGPDREDQRGALTYDPTNGSFSAGDIMIRTPRK